MDDTADYSALERFWPQGRKYGQPGTWFAFVGRKLRQRQSTEHTPDGQPRGLCCGIPCDAATGAFEVSR